MFDINDWAIGGLDVGKVKNFLEKNREFRTLMLEYRCALMEMETKLRVLDEEFSLYHDRNPIESIKTRLKEPVSIIEKLSRKGAPLSIQSIPRYILDVAGVRVVCSFEEDVYYLRDCLLAQDDVELLGEKDYIQKPKDSGYRSLHLTIRIPVFFAEEVRYVPVEIQLRTIAMDFWASIEHIIRYKSHLEEDAYISRELYACALSSRRWDEKMADLMRLTKERLEKAKEDSQVSLEGKNRKILGGFSKGEGDQE